MSSRLAQQLYDMGFRVWPIIPETKTPAARGFGADKGKVSYHPDDFGDNDVAVLTGPCALGNLVCVDLDEGEWPEWLIRTPTLTSKGGRHRWYNDPTGRVRQKVRWLPGIDVKAGLGAYAIESRGGRLLFDNLDAPIADLPQGPEAWPVGYEVSEAPPPPTPVAGKKYPGDRFRDSWTARLVRDPSGGNKLAGGLGRTLASWGHDADFVEETIRAWTGGADPKLDKHINDARRAVEAYARGEPAPGIPSLATLGVVVEDDSGGLPKPPPGKLGGETIAAASIACMTLPPVPWLIERYGVCPGAPTIIAGHAGAGKTYLLQDLALAVATPKRHWLGEPVRHGRVLHIDHEQGMRETVGRYKDLQIDERAELEVCIMPLWRLSLDERGETIRKLAEGRALILIDSLRASLPGVDENESGVRAWLDTLTAVSSDTGCVFCLIHHARKGSGEERGSLDVVRGSSGIVDAAGTVLTLTVPSYEDGEPRPSPILRLAKARTWSPKLDWTPQTVQLSRPEADRSEITGEAVVGASQRIEQELRHHLERLGPDKVARMTKTALINFTTGKKQTVLKVLSRLLDEYGWATRSQGNEAGETGGNP